MRSLEELAESVREHGVIEPIVVRPVGERYEIVAGERRHRASGIAGEESIPARIMDLDAQSAAFVTAIENLQREDLDIEDEARQFAYLLQLTGLSQRKLAEKLGVQFNYLSRRVRLLRRPDLMEEYRSGRRTLHQVLAMLESGAAGAEEAAHPEAGGNEASPAKESVSAGYTPADGAGEDEDLQLIEREDLPGFIVSRGYGGYEGRSGSGYGGHRGDERDTGTPSGAVRGGDSTAAGRGARFRWRPVQQFYNWVGRTRVTDIPPDERATVRAQLTEIKEALEKQLAELDELGNETGEGGAATTGDAS
jgi:ParB/RepB/Spo0J family partition protein